ncbi:MAG: carboxyl transferase domain-containing protein [Dehalococcoidales bacterium]|nr:carboxyl transferase domain-containing protein [Dehalococcoidales bacterium]
MGMEDGLKELQARREKALRMGGAEQVAAQHARGRLTARERIDKLLDPGTFFELGMLNLSERPEMAEFTAADGRVCGFGKINGRMSLVIAEDRTALGGSDGFVGVWRKHTRLHKLATEKGYPVIHLGDNLGGARIPDSMGSDGMSRAAISPDWIRPSRQTPRIATIMGTCFGMPSWMARISDFVVQVKGATMAAAGPRILKIAIGEEVTPEDLGNWELRYKQTGEVDAVAENEEECLAIVREFLSYMPSHNGEEPPVVTTSDPVTRQIEDAGKIVPDQMNRGYDMHRLIKRIADDGKYFEIKAGYGRSLITCLSRIGGRVVGFIANNPMIDAGAPSVQSCEKAASFICLCDSFNIPLIFLADVPGMFPGSVSEKQHLPTKIMNWHQAEVLATVPKIAIVIRKAYGMGWNVMLSPNESGELVVAWPTASVSFVDPEIGIELVDGRRIAESADPEAEREKLRQKWAVDSSPWKAAELHHFDDIIDPRDTRRWLAQALEVLRGKRGNFISQHELKNWPLGF